MARILAVEDTPHNLELLTYLLSAHGHEVDPATTAAAALDCAARRRPDLVLLDVHLPDADGFQVLALLREQVGLADVPIVAVTAYAMLGDREHAVACGFDDYLTKPIDPHTFAATVQRLLTLGPGRKDRSSPGPGLAPGRT
jgi:CheY-like chemotaxis protein